MQLFELRLTPTTVGFPDIPACVVRGATSKVMNPGPVMVNCVSDFDSACGRVSFEDCTVCAPTRGAMMRIEKRPAMVLATVDVAIIKRGGLFYRN